MNLSEKENILRKKPHGAAKKTQIASLSHTFQEASHQAHRSIKQPTRSPSSNLGNPFF